MILDALLEVDKDEAHITDEFRKSFVPRTTYWRWVIFGFYVVNILVLSGESLSFSPVSYLIA